MDSNGIGVRERKHRGRARRGRGNENVGTFERRNVGTLKKRKILGGELKEGTEGGSSVLA